MEATADHTGGAGGPPTQSNVGPLIRFFNEGARWSFNTFNFFGTNRDSNAQDFIQNNDEVVNPIAPDATSNTSGPRSSRRNTDGTLKSAQDTENGLSAASGAQEYMRDDSVPDESFARRGTAKHGGHVASANITAEESTGYDDL